MQEKKSYKYYDLIMAAFVAVLLCSNLIGVQKVSSINLPFYGEYIYGAGVLFFPISYLFGDVLVAFYGSWSNEQLISVMIGNYFIKVLWEIVATPLTYLIVEFLKKAEHEDYYDKNTDFNPFSLET